jgi:FMNH2-dependent dimethyl sulfone monooxygenase
MPGSSEPPRTTMFNQNKLKLGIFSPNCSGGMAVTKVPERWDASWENNLKLAQMADDAGIEFLLPIARWKGYGGETDFEGSTLETITWACGLLAKTKRITVFGTVHAPLVHPIFAAKQMVTVSHVSEGRFGLNIVCGWNQDEFEMFGIAQREHDTRYEYGQEWWDVVQKIWSEDAPFDYNGRL